MTQPILRAEYKEKIIEVLEKFFAELQKDAVKVSAFGGSIPQQFLEFTTSGKMVRGSLILFVSESLSTKITKDAILAAAAIELFHSSLLIHDDIMDNDELRRGNKTIFQQYVDIGRKNNFVDSKHFGQSMGICVGDIGFFLGMEMLTKISDKQKSNELIAFFAKELTSVGLAQMQDVYNSHESYEEDEESIEQVYRYKTARYTFSLPMIIGALLNNNPRLLPRFEQLGEAFGLLFQLVDDKINLFGSEKITGKPVGSDIRENKKTLYHLYLFQAAKDAEKEKLKTIFGKQNITNEDITYVLNLLEIYKVQSIIDRKITDLQNNAKTIIADLPLSQESKYELIQFLEFITNRNK